MSRNSKISNNLLAILNKAEKENGLVTAIVILSRPTPQPMLEEKYSDNLEHRRALIARQFTRMNNPAKEETINQFSAIGLDVKNSESLTSALVITGTAQQIKQAAELPEVISVSENARMEVIRPLTP